MLIRRCMLSLVLWGFVWKLVGGIEMSDGTVRTYLLLRPLGSHTNRVVRGARNTSVVMPLVNLPEGR